MLSVLGKVLEHLWKPWQIHQSGIRGTSWPDRGTGWSLDTVKFEISCKVEIPLGSVAQQV